MFNLRPEETMPLGDGVFGPFAGILQEIKEIE